MKLSDLSRFPDLVIQCHNNPDADSIGAGFVLYEYCRMQGQHVRLVYSGRFLIEKSNLLYLIDQLDIPIEYVDQLVVKPSLLVLVDCQYDGGNVRRLPADHVAVIDHHQVSTELPELSEVRSDANSCCTILWDMIRSEHGEAFLKLPRIATALYYGLYTDTNGFSEITHPLDMDMRDTLPFHRGLFTQLRNRNMSLREARIAGVAMLGAEYHEDHHYAMLQTDPCDPNILGLISDFYLSVDRVDVCLVYSVMDAGVKFSVRSCVKEVRANELAAFLADRIGNGGGHDEKAGGLLSRKRLEKEYPKLATVSEESKRLAITEFMRARMDAYYRICRLIDAKYDTVDCSDMKLYHKLPVVVGWVRARNLQTPIVDHTVTIRMPGDETQAQIHRDSIFVINGEGEVYVLCEKNFQRNYEALQEPFTAKFDYDPTVREQEHGGFAELLPVARKAIGRETSRIYAVRLESMTKVFTKWNRDRYMLGEPGDYLAVREDDAHDIYIIRRNTFEKSYRSVT